MSGSTSYTAPRLHGSPNTSSGVDAVDHALASGDTASAVDLVEQDETNLLEQSRMTTLLGIVAKLPAQLVVSRARLQLVVAWAHILLQHTTSAFAAF